jgi:hypothetical protein
MSDPNTLLDQSIRHGLQSIVLQLDAKAAIPPSSSGVVIVTPGQSLPELLASLPGGDTVYVLPTVHTVLGEDLHITKPLKLVGAAFTGRLVIDAPDVALIGCSIVGPNENGALLTTGGDRLLLQGCRLQGSFNGQHRGILVQSADVTICDSSITGIWKSGQETQAIAGWKCIKRLKVIRTLMEAAGVNFMIGGTDCAEDEIPEDIEVRRCYLRKPWEWKGWTGAKNLFEIKNARRVLLEDSLLELSWVEGQVGYALLLNVRNQEGTAPWSTIEDVIIRRNRIRWVAAGLNLLGSDYTHPSQVMKRVTIEDNVIERIERTYGDNQRCLYLAHGGQDIAIRRNTFSGTDINSFLTFEGAPLERFVFEQNTVPEGAYGIKSDDCSLGTPTLEKYAPGCTWNANTVVRTIATNNIPYPPGTTVVTGTK